MLNARKLKIIAAIPCFNTEPHIGDIVSRAKKYVDKVIVINDGSDDQTNTAAQDAGAMVISHEVNQGYDEAIRSCFRAASSEKADVLVILDGDAQHDPDEIPFLLGPILNQAADLVIGSRFMTKEHNMPGYRKFGISVITLLWNVGSRINVTDSQSGFRAYTKNAFEMLRVTEKGMGASIEILEQARRANLSIKEVPISCVYSHAAIHTEAITHGLQVALAVLKVRLKYHHEVRV